MAWFPEPVTRLPLVREGQNPETTGIVEGRLREETEVAVHLVQSSQRVVAVAVPIMIVGWVRALLAVLAVAVAYPIRRFHLAEPG